jgi:hypothetical protein
MSVRIEFEADDIYVVRIDGILKPAEFRAEQNALA